MNSLRPHKFSLAGIYAISDPQLLSASRLLAASEAALKGGISVLQFRDKTNAAELRQRLARELLILCRRYNRPLLINDDVALCKAIGADGVHLGQQDMPLTEARQELGDQAVIGITCHQSVALAEQAESSGADYVAFGRFYPSSTKPDAPAANTAILAEAKSRLAVPVVAIGGINAENGAALVQAGADMLAVVHSLFAAADVSASADRLLRLFSHTQKNCNPEPKESS